MIVRNESDGSLVMISQNDHAKTAGFCAAHWGNSQFEKPRPFDSTVRATILHDLAWLPEEAAPRFNAETGRTPNYRDVPAEDQIEATQWANGWISSRDPYAALLVSKHRTGIWKSRYGIMKQPHYRTRRLSREVEAFVDRLHAEQMVAAASFDRNEVAINYHLLQIWDLFSLYICSNEHLEQRFFEPVPTSYSNGTSVYMQLTPVAPARISVNPFPFDQSSLDVTVVYRRLPRNVFDDEKTLRTSYFCAVPQVAKFTFFDPESA